MNCHNNVNHYVSEYGGEKISGYYLITDNTDDSYGCAIYHSIWKDNYDRLLDITPFSDNRNYNMFSILNTKEYYSGILYDGEKYNTLQPGINTIMEIESYVIGGIAQDIKKNAFSGFKL